MMGGTGILMPVVLEPARHDTLLGHARGRFGCEFELWLQEEWELGQQLVFWKLCCSTTGIKMPLPSCMIEGTSE